MDFELTPERACILGDVAVISDLHLGIENAMQESGIAIPRLQVRKILEDVDKIVKKYGISKIVVAGDLKHELSKNLPYEWVEVKKFVEKIFESGVKLEIVRGNHDNFLDLITSRYGLELKDFTRVQEFLVTHGHKEIGGEKFVIGHEHPCVKLRVYGVVYKYPCYLIVDRKIVVLPAFSKIVPGTNALSKDYLSPMLKKAKEIEVFALEDEVLYLGKIDDLLKLS